MTRKEFVQLSAGLMGGLGISEVLDDPVRAAEKEGSVAGSVLDESYLVKGLTGMARSKGWFPAHLGAAVLSGYYLCQGNRLKPEVVAAIKKQLDALIETVTPEQFEPLPEEPADPALIERIPASLAEAVAGGLRAHGHAVIYTSLTVRALRAVPEMAQATLIDKLCAHNLAIAKHRPQKPLKPTTYADSGEMVKALFDNLARFEPLLGRPSVRRPNFTHMTTHTEALLTLDELGYGELSRAGHLGHQAHVGELVPDFDPTGHPVVEAHPSLETIMGEGFWDSNDHQHQWNQMWSEKDNPNGYWIAFGHLFKVLYAYHRLVPLMEDKAKVQLCSRVLLERYFNPQVSGG